MKQSSKGIVVILLVAIQVPHYTLLLLLALFMFSQVGVRLFRRAFGRCFPLPSFCAAYLENPIRLSIQSPKKICDRLDAEPNMIIAEIGPGPGTFTTDVAQRVSPNGVVLALDISSKMIQKLKGKMLKEGIKNIVPIVATACYLPLLNDSIDRVFMVAVLAEISDRQRALRECVRVLRSDGFISISEYVTDPDYPLKRTVTEWCNEAGLRRFSQHGGLLEYTLNFRLKS